jgi:hypothetical protein
MAKKNRADERPAEVDACVDAAKPSAHSHTAGAGKSERLLVDADQMDRFVRCVFKNASGDGHVSLRTFAEHDRTIPPISVRGVKLSRGVDTLVKAAVKEAQKAAAHEVPAVFCPPIATFKDSYHAREEDLDEGPVITVECDENPKAALMKLGVVIGYPTLLLESGGTTAEDEAKTHMHWRLTVPARGPEQLAKLKEVRILAAKLVGADPTSGPIPHPIRWAGAWHRKGKPKLARIVEQTENEFDLDTVLAKLQAAIGVTPGSKSSGRADDRETETLEANVRSGREYHPSLVPLAMRKVVAGGEKKAIIKELETLMDSVTAAKDQRWADRRAQIPAIVESAFKKLKSRSQTRLEEFNKIYCVVRVRGKTLVCYFEEDSGREEVSFQSFDDFKKYHCDELVATFPYGMLKLVPLGEWWLTHKHRRKYKGIVFKPGKNGTIPETPGYLNLWRGFAVEPAKGDWSLMQRHIEEVIADGNLVHAKYILNYCAWMAQNPGERAEVALALKGDRGVGKGCFLEEFLQRIFGQHSFTATSMDHIVGKHNAHLQDCVMLFANEAVWPGLRAAEGTIKSIITAEWVYVEPKYVNRYGVRNCIHLIMDTNEDWMVPAGPRERRFAVFDVSSKHIQDRLYFAPIFAEAKNGGPAAMLHDLLAMDLKGWHPRDDIPQTKALRQQQVRSLPGELGWWHDILDEGRLPSFPPLAAARCPTKWLYEDYRRTVGPHAMSSTALGILLNRLAPGLTKSEGTFSTPEGKVSGNCYRFPSLAECRKAFDQMMRLDYKDADATAWGTPRDWLALPDDDGGDEANAAGAGFEAGYDAGLAASAGEPTPVSSGKPPF